MTARRKNSDSLDSLDPPNPCLLFNTRTLGLFASTGRAPSSLPAALGCSPLSFASPNATAESRTRDRAKCQKQTGNGSEAGYIWGSPFLRLLLGPHGLLLWTGSGTHLSGALLSGPLLGLRVVFEGSRFRGEVSRSTARLLSRPQSPPVRVTHATPRKCARSWRVGGC